MLWTTKLPSAQNAHTVETNTKQNDDKNRNITVIGDSMLKDM